MEKTKPAASLGTNAIICKKVGELDAVYNICIDAIILLSIFVNYMRSH